MTEESFKRKLTAILSADVKDQSRLTGEDEDTIVRNLTSYRTPRPILSSITGAGWWIHLEATC